MAISKTQQVERLEDKLDSLVVDKYTGEVELRFQHGNIVHVATVYSTSMQDVMGSIKELCEKDFYGKMTIKMENGVFALCMKTDNEKLDT